MKFKDTKYGYISPLNSYQGDIIDISMTNLTSLEGCPPIVIGNFDCSNNKITSLKYAPKNVKHLNCYEMGWPNNIPTIFIPFYAMTGGGKSEKIKQGYWIDYAPNHKISWEGSYKDNQRIGVFKFYDSNGNFINTETYKPFPSLAIYIYTIFGIIILFN